MSLSSLDKFTSPLIKSPSLFNPSTPVTVPAIFNISGAITVPVETNHLKALPTKVPSPPFFLLLSFGISILLNCKDTIRYKLEYLFCLLALLYEDI